MNNLTLMWLLGFCNILGFWLFFKENELLHIKLGLNGGRIIALSMVISTVFFTFFGILDLSGMFAKPDAIYHGAMVCSLLLAMSYFTMMAVSEGLVSIAFGWFCAINLFVEKFAIVEILVRR